MSLELDVRLDGFADPIGRLVRDERSNLWFAYTPGHLGNGRAMPLSLSLPLTDQPYGDVQARAFFGNLLQERDGELGQIMARHGLERGDVVGLLLHLGADCAGAISVLPSGAPPAKVPGNLDTDYVRLEDRRLAEIVTSLHQHRR